MIARENKGPGIGIEYAYSRAATNVANPSPSQLQGLRKSIWVAGDTGPGQAVPQQTTTPAPTTTRQYIRPSVKSLGGGPPYTARLGNNYGSYREQDEDIHENNFVQPVDEQIHDDDNSGAGPWYVYECIPLLKNMAGYEDGSKKNSVLTKFIKHMNKNAVGSVKNFIGSEKSCSSGYEGRERGYLVQTNTGDNKCCSTPWSANTDSVCYDQFARNVISTLHHSDTLLILFVTDVMEDVFLMTGSVMVGRTVWTELMKQLCQWMAM